MSQLINRYYSRLQNKYTRRINLSLTRIKKALINLNNTKLRLLNVVQFAGSSGKFSTQRSLRYFLEADKKNVSALISPHLVSVTERFYIKKKYLSLDKIKKYQKIIEKTKIKLTLYEMLCLVFYLACKDEKNIQFNLCELGVGYRFDAVNVFKSPKAVIISNLNLQHKDILNVKTIRQVCIEKCGYLPKNTKVFIGKQKASTLKIIREVLKKSSNEIFYPNKWKIIYKKNKIFYKDAKNIIQIKNSYIFSKGLIDNLGLAIYVALNFDIKKSIIKRTIPKIKFVGRIQYIKKGRLRKLIHPCEDLVVDGCHAPAEARNLASYLKTVKKPLYGIVGILKNKDPENIIKQFRGLFEKIICIEIPSEPNSCSAAELRLIAKKYCCITDTANSIQEALIKLTDKKRKKIIFFGSLYGVSAALSIN